MAEHCWSVLCNKAIIDRDSGQVTIFEAVENLNIPHAESEMARETGGAEGEVVIQHSLQLVTLWVRSDLRQGEQAEARVRLFCPAGEEVQSWDVPVDLQEHSSLRWRLVFPGVPWRGKGRYWYNVELKSGENWEKCSRAPLVLAVKATEKE